METKICRKCNIEKETCEFGKTKQNKDGLKSYCNECRRIESKEYRLKHPEKRKKTIKKYYENNQDSELRRFKEYRINNPEKRKKTVKNYYENNKKIINKKQGKLNKKYYQNNVLYRIIVIQRGRIREILKIKNKEKKIKTIDIVGCSPEFLKEHLEKQFKDGMTWENYGFYGWHIDHIIPLSSAKTEEEVYKLCHYTNLQPLWAEDNLKKGSKIL